MFNSISHLGLSYRVLPVGGLPVSLEPMFGCWDRREQGSNQPFVSMEKTGL